MATKEEIEKRRRKAYYKALHIYLEALSAVIKAQKKYDKALSEYKGD